MEAEPRTLVRFEENNYCNSNKESPSPLNTELK